ncbi:amino acid adenylation domain-containing protein [Streptomyces cacaoi]|uniref:amino acid adenylation domain-containing protein n=1 Tax=Streptomyces cacaoi TaxID=1898 RepID=UPI003748072F
MTWEGVLATAECLPELFDRTAERFPDAVAVTGKSGSLTYAELRTRAESLAHRIREEIPGTGSRIGIRLSRDIFVPVAVLAVLKSGNAYVPLDPEYPEERVRFMAEDAEVRALVSDRPAGPGTPAVPHLPVAGPDAADRPAGAAPLPAVAPGDPAYVIYTSGSTGRPKGVAVAHESVLALLDGCAGVFDIDEHDVWTLFHSYCFDFSVWEMWGAFAHGSRLVVVDADVAASPERTVRLLADEGVTVLNQVPSVFRTLARVARDTAPPAPPVRHVIFGGEPLAPHGMRNWREAFGPGTVFHNMYGITETTVFVTAHRVPEHAIDGDATLPIGLPLKGYDTVVVDEDDKPVPPGGQGELLVSGTAVALGYLNRPELTAERFVELALPEREPARYYRSGDIALLRHDGLLEHLGRRDNQVKLHGYRIETGEIETVLATADGVQEVAVVVGTTAAGHQVLVAFYVADENLDRTLRSTAFGKLPLHMVPVGYRRLDALPLSPSGKTDRTALERMPV